MTASPTPPPALPRKPAYFDAPFWGWVILVSLVAVNALGLVWSLKETFGLSTGRSYQLSQAEPPSAQGVWEALAAWGAGSAHWAVPVLLILTLAIVVVAALRYRLAVVWAGVGVVASLVVIVQQTLAWGPYVEYALWTVLPSGLALWVWRLRLSRGRRRLPLPPLALTAVALVAMALAMMLWGSSASLWQGEVAFLWFGDWVRADLILVGRGWVLFSGLALWLLVEKLGALRPNRQAIKAGWACAGLVASLVIWRSPPSEYLNATQGWPLFAVGEPVEGTALAWESPDRWGIDDTTFYPELSASLTDLIASGRASESVKLAITAPWPDYVEFMYDPFAPTAEYLAQLRLANPAINMGSEGRMMGSFLAKVPLTDAEVDDWLGMVYTLPSPIKEDMALLANLVGSGRRERAAILLTHIQGGLSRADERYGALEGNALAARLRRDTLLTAYGQRLAQLGQPDGLSRAVSIRVVGADGLPLAGVPVGIYQTFGTLPGYVAREGAEVREEEMAFTTGGRFLRTDANGMAVFEDLRAASYANTVLSGWPDSGLGKGMLAFPQTDLPNPLPAGLTEVVWRVLPQGTFTQAPDGSLALVPEPTGPVVWGCAIRENDIGHRCPEVLDLSDKSVRQQPPGPEWNRVDAIMEVGPAGRPRFVWWFVAEETEAAEDAPALADDTP
ncbi:hypothetical protein IIA16_01805 [bacterium]|nr:hypothetical protein [bacterium]